MKGYRKNSVILIYLLHATSLYKYKRNVEKEYKEFISVLP